MQTLKQKQSLITANHKEIENLPLATRKDYMHLIMCINTAKNTLAELKNSNQSLEVVGAKISIVQSALLDFQQRLNKIKDKFNLDF